MRNVVVSTSRSRAVYLVFSEFVGTKENTLLLDFIPESKMYPAEKVGKIFDLKSDTVLRYLRTVKNDGSMRENLQAEFLNLELKNRNKLPDRLRAILILRKYYSWKEIGKLLKIKPDSARRIKRRYMAEFKKSVKFSACQ